MYNINAPYTVERIESVGKGEKYLLTVWGRPYSVGELVYLIVEYLSAGKSKEEISGLLNAWQGVNTTLPLRK